MKGQTNRYSDSIKKLIGSYHKGKTITEKHRKAISIKNSGISNPHSKSISLIHKDTPNITKTFVNILQASKELSINYSSLKSQYRLKTKSYNRKGWKILYDISGEV